MKKVSVDYVGQQHESADYLELNPFGELPILEDGSLRLRNAQAILTYIARKYDKFGTWYRLRPIALREFTNGSPRRAEISCM
jgi:glutathione S-transferase